MVRGKKMKCCYKCKEKNCFSRCDIVKNSELCFDRREGTDKKISDEYCYKTAVCKRYKEDRKC